MEHEDLVVGRQPEVAFDTGAKLQRGGEGEQAILGESGTMMQAAVREAGRAGIERIRL